MKLFNTETRNVEVFKPNSKNEVTLYTCGPTVYNTQHLGNWSTFIRYDVLARWLKVSGYKLNWIMNITDVGHLVSDADEGEDKIQKKAKKEGKTAWDIADYYSEEFVKYTELFNISISQKNLIKATDCVEEQINLIKQLETSKQTYITDDGVYFDSSTFKDYGKMARLDIKGLEKGKRIGFGHKRNPTDFALWKFSKKTENRDMEWKSPWGKGFPGWHLECSAIANKYLGETIDIHSGGIEHIPIHHTNEIAQSESANNQKFVNYWVHNSHLFIDGKKISKSLNNGISPRQMVDKGYSFTDFRLFVLTSHYTTTSNFTWGLLEEAMKTRLKIQALADLRYQTMRLEKNSRSIKEITQEVSDAMDNNLNTPLALSKILGFIDKINSHLPRKDSYEFVKFLEWLDNVFGLNLLLSKDISDESKKLIDKRNELRLSKEFEQADQIRAVLKEKFIILEDFEEQTIWYRSR